MSTDQTQRPRPAPEPTLLAHAIAYIDETIACRRAELDDLVQQIHWLEQERTRVLDEAAAEDQKRQTRGRTACRN